MNPRKMQLLGKTVREARQQAGFSLVRLALEMGWQGTSPLVAIEKGRRLPQPDTIERLGERLQMPHTDIVYLQGLAGYRQPTQLPAAKRIRAVFQEIIAAYPPEHLIFPVYVLDYQFRVWMSNLAPLIYLNDAVAVMRDFVERRRTLFEIIFDAQLNWDHTSTNHYEIKRDQVYRFKARNLFRRSEDFYLAYPECMEPLLAPADFALFKTIWDDVQTDSVGLYRIKTLNKTLVNGVPMDFILEDAPIPQLDDLFFMVSYYPEPSAENIRNCQAVFGNLPPADTRWFIPSDVA